MGATPPSTKRKGGERLTRSFMPAPMFASTECSSTELAFVLFIRNVLRLRSFGRRCDSCCGSCSSSSRHYGNTTLESSTRIPRVKRMRLSDTGVGMTMDWTYAKRISFDHAFGVIATVAGGEGSLGDGASLVLAASLIWWRV